MIQVSDRVCGRQATWSCQEGGAVPAAALRYRMIPLHRARSDSDDGVFVTAAEAAHYVCSRRSRLEASP